MRDIENGHIVKYRLPCDNCGSSDAKVRYEAGDTFCFSCQTVGDMQRKNESNTGYARDNEDTGGFMDTSKPDLSFYYKADFKPIKERRLDEDTCKKFGVRVNDKGHILFPAYDKKGELVAVKVRLWPEKDFRIVGNMKEAVPFGMDKFPKTGRSLTITEGEMDAMSAYKMTGSKYPHISIWNGAGSAVKEVKAAFNELKEFENIVLNFDADKPGKEAVEKVGPLLAGRAKVMELTEGKDANEYLMQNKGSKYVDEFHRAKKFTLGGIMNGADTWEKYKEKKNVKSIPFDPQYVELNQKTCGIRLGEIVLVTAGTGCVDRDTEFMSQDGWKAIGDYVSTDKVLQMDNNRKATFVTPNEYVKIPASTLTRISNTGYLDQVLSDEHRVLYEGSKGLLELPFKEVRRRAETNVGGFAGKLPTTFDYSGTGVDYTEGELRLQVAVMADGRIVKEGKNNYTHMRFSKERKYLRLLEICEKYNLPYKVMPKEGIYYCVVVYPKTRDKHFTKEYYNCTTEQFNIILDEVMYWDARYLKLNDYVSTDKRDTTFIQFAAHATGKRGTISVDRRTSKYTNGYCGTVHISDIQTVTMDPKKLKIDDIKTKDGYKYCFSVDSGILVLRRNGKVFVTGNSGKTQVLREWKYNLLQTTLYNIMDISLEEDVGDTIGGLMSLHANKRIHLPDVHIDEVEERKLHTELYGEGRFTLLDHEGSVDDTSLLDKMEYAAVVDNCQIQFLDHITIAVSDCEVGTENVTMDKFMSRLLKMVKRLNICVIVVSHLRKQGQGKSFEEGRVPTEDDLKGSGSLKQIAMTTIAIARNKYAETEQERNTTSFHVLKCRFTGRTGPADYAYFDDDTGRMNVIDPAEFFDDTQGFGEVKGSF